VSGDEIPGNCSAGKRFAQQAYDSATSDTTPSFLIGRRQIAPTFLVFCSVNELGCPSYFMLAAAFRWSAWGDWLGKSANNQGAASRELFSAQ
jgi:hypothetical protein